MFCLVVMVFQYNGPFPIFLTILFTAFVSTSSIHDLRARSRVAKDAATEEDGECLEYGDLLQKLIKGMRRDNSQDRKPTKEYVQNYGEYQSCWGYDWKGNMAPENLTEIEQKPNKPLTLVVSYCILAG